MATFRSGLLSFEINYLAFKKGYTQYEICFRWGTEPIVNQEILRPLNDWWGARTPGCFFAEDHGDSLLSTIARVLETDEPRYWEPIEPAVILAIYPEMDFPFLQSNYKLIYQSHRAKQAQQERERQKSQQLKLDKDQFTLIVFFDKHHFKESQAYSGEGIALHLVMDRWELKDFYFELSREYSAFAQKYRIDEYEG
jgi:hypothetical protein